MERHTDMEQFDFTLGFSVMASDELDARVKLKDLLKAISKEEILWAMKLVENNKSPSSKDKSPSRNNKSPSSEVTL